MPKVYAKHPGAVIRLGNFGEATEAVPVEVPGDVAMELADQPDLRIETDDDAKPAPRLAPKAHKQEGR